jgi:CRISPR-associated endonuclease/helicase Cas3
MLYYAHSGRDPGKADWQRLDDHLRSVARLAGAFGKKMGFHRAASAAGLLHDLGKYTADFQFRLEGKDIRVDHSTAGAKIFFDRAKGPDKAIGEIIAYAILGHHAGLPDKLNETNGCYDRRMEGGLPALDPVWETELAADMSGLVPDMARRFAGNAEERGFAWAFMGRMIFSCLVVSSIVRRSIA